MINKGQFSTLTNKTTSPRLLLLIIIAFTALLYIPVFNNQITNWDDDSYIINNPYIKGLSFDNILHIFTNYFMGNYHPLTMLVTAIGYQIANVHPWIYHLISLAFHLFNTVLVYIFIEKLLRLKTEKVESLPVIPLFTALLFAIHTFQVESVAWISEIKNVLYAFFFLASLISYTNYVERKSTLAYFLSLLLFLLSLLSKGMAAPLSLTIICIDYFSGRNLLSKKVILEKIPFLVLSLLFGYIAIKAQVSSDSLITGNNFPWYSRIAIASFGFVQYIIKLIYPYNLSAFYPYVVKPGMTLPFTYYICIFVALSLFFIIWRYFRHNRILIFGLLFFILNIGMVIQLIPVGNAIMADRYVYIPSIGLLLIIAYIIAILWQRNKYSRYIAISVISLYCILLSFKTYERIGIWKDSLTLWNDAIQKYPLNNDKGYQNRAAVFYEKGIYNRAMEDYKKVLSIDPKNAGAYLGIGLIKQVLNDTEGAMKDYNTALSLGPIYEGYLNRAVLKMNLYDYNGAIDDLNKAYQLDSSRADVFINLGTLFYQTGNYSNALENYNKALQIDPVNSKTFLGRGMVKQVLNDTQGAMNDFNAALSISDSYDGYYNRAVLKIGLQDLQGALTDLNQATALNPSITDAHVNKGYIHFLTGNYLEALKHYNQALTLDRHDSRAFNGRGRIKQAINDFTGAMCDFDSSLLYSSSYDGFINRAVLKIQLNNLNSAKDDLNEAYKKDSARSDVYLFRGIIYLKQGRKTDGWNDLKRASAMGNTWADQELEKLE